MLTNWYTFKCFILLPHFYSHLIEIISVLTAKIEGKLQKMYHDTLNTSMKTY